MIREYSLQAAGADVFANDEFVQSGDSEPRKRDLPNALGIVGADGTRDPDELSRA